MEMVFKKNNLYTPQFAVVFKKIDMLRTLIFFQYLFITVAIFSLFAKIYFHDKSQNGGRANFKIFYDLFRRIFLIKYLFFLPTNRQKELGKDYKTANFFLLVFYISFAAAIAIAIVLQFPCSP